MFKRANNFNTNISFLSTAKTYRPNNIYAVYYTDRVNCDTNKLQDDPKQNGEISFQFGSNEVRKDLRQNKLHIQCSDGLNPE